LPAFIVKAGAFPGDSLATETYLDSRDIQGKMADIFQQALSFILANITHIQGGQGVNYGLCRITLPSISLMIVVETFLYV
jgi:ATP-dependent DNA helicase RecG